MRPSLMQQVHVDLIYRLMAAHGMVVAQTPTRGVIARESRPFGWYTEEVPRWLVSLLGI